MQMFILPGAIKSALLRYDVEFMASDRHPQVKIDFDNPEFRFYLSLDELFKLRRDHRIDDGSHSEYAIRGGFEFEPGDRIESLIRGVGHVPATVVKEVHQGGFGTNYKVKPDFTPPAPRHQSLWRRWLNRLLQALRRQPVIWPNEVTYYLRPITPSHLIRLDRFEQG